MERIIGYYIFLSVYSNLEVVDILEEEMSHLGPNEKYIGKGFIFHMNDLRIENIHAMHFICTTEMDMHILEKIFDSNSPVMDLLNGKEVLTHLILSKSEIERFIISGEESI